MCRNPLITCLPEAKTQKYLLLLSTYTPEYVFVSMLKHKCFAPKCAKLAFDDLPISLKKITDFDAMLVSRPTVETERPGSLVIRHWVSFDYFQWVWMNCPTSKECTFSFGVGFFPLQLRLNILCWLKINTVWFICHGYTIFFLLLWLNNIIHNVAVCIIK